MAVPTQDSPTQDPPLPELLAPTPVGTGNPASLIRLTARELEVLERAADGMSRDQIADDLAVSPSTVAYHLSKMYRLAEVGSRHQLTLLWRRHPELFGPRSTTGAGRPVDGVSAPAG